LSPWSIANGSRECAPDDRLGDAFRDERFKRCLVILTAKRSFAWRNTGRGDANGARECASGSRRFQTFFAALDCFVAWLLAMTVCEETAERPSRRTRAQFLN